MSLGVVRELFLGKPAPEKHNLGLSKFSGSPIQAVGLTDMLVGATGFVFFVFVVLAFVFVVLVFALLTYPNSLTHRHEGWWNCHSRSQLRTPPPRESMEFPGYIFCKRGGQEKT